MFTLNKTVTVLLVW